MSTEVRDPERWLDDVRDRLTRDLEFQRVQLQQLTADTGDPGEAHTRDALISATQQSIDQTDRALRRISDGSYGRCDRCGQDIPRERLEALPHARYCVPCQQRV